ncbi:MAG: hypothetical protein JWQ09_2460 [Segetibacter sp.]|nr:hypothetical protein [Segetibacter sp.]
MRRIFLKPTVLVLTTAVLLSSCASIVSKSSYPVSIRTNPVGSNVSITDKKGKEVYKGQSPATVTLKSGAGFFSKAEYQVKLSSPGFAEKIVPINYKINGWYFGNLLLGGVVGMLIIDPATGAMWRIQDPVIDENLVKTTASISTTPTLNIVDIKDISKELRSHLVRVK